MTASERDLAGRLKENLAGVRDRIAAAAARSGRSADCVRLVGVTKYVDVPAIRTLIACGLTDLGESRPQDLWKKAEQLRDLPIRWHMIGHLQRNKVRRTLPLIALLHSGDSQRLLQEVNDEAAAAGGKLEALLEVNISGDATKHGFQPRDLAEVLPGLASLTNLQIRGLMGMAALEGGAERARRDFAALRELRESLRRNCPSNVSLDELSMGMSGDYEVAVEEGATIVRVGSALFEGFQSPDQWSG